MAKLKLTKAISVEYAKANAVAAQLVKLLYLECSNAEEKFIQ